MCPVEGAGAFEKQHCHIGEVPEPLTCVCGHVLQRRVPSHRVLFRSKHLSQRVPFGLRPRRRCQCHRVRGRRRRATIGSSNLLRKGLMSDAVISSSVASVSSPFLMRFIIWAHAVASHGSDVRGSCAQGMVRFCCEIGMAFWCVAVPPSKGVGLSVVPPYYVGNGVFHRIGRFNGVTVCSRLPLVVARMAKYNYSTALPCNARRRRALRLVWISGVSTIFSRVCNCGIASVFSTSCPSKSDNILARIDLVSSLFSVLSSLVLSSLFSFIFSLFFRLLFHLLLSCPHLFRLLFSLVPSFSVSFCLCLRVMLCVMLCCVVCGSACGVCGGLCCVSLLQWLWLWSWCVCVCGVACVVWHAEKTVWRFKTFLCVHSKRLRVHRQKVHTFFTCGRGAGTHGDV